MDNSAALLDLTNLPWDSSLPTHIIFDVDGTLTDQESRTSPQTFQALRDLTATGIKIILATGRTFGSSDIFLKKAKIPAKLVCAGGAVTWNNGKITATYHPQSAVKTAVEYGKSHGITLLLESVDTLLLDEDAPYIPPLLRTASEGMPIARGDVYKAAEEKTVKVTFCGRKELLDNCWEEITERFPGTVRGHASFIDFPPVGISKWTGIQKILQEEQLDPAEGLGVGDSGNDVPWIAHMGYPLAAPQATPDLLAVTKWQLPRSTHHIADFAAAILQHQKI